jgi:hypothetical protein
MERHSGPNLAGYNVYRSASAAGPFTRINATLVSGLTWDDTSAPGTADFYRVTAVNTFSVESAPTATASATLPVANRLGNPGFELDANGDTRPDIWSTNNAVTRSNLVVRSESFAMRHFANTNVSYTISQTASGLSSGNTYVFGGWVNIPTTNHAFTFTLQIRWRTAVGAVIRTDTIRTYNAATAGWNKTSASLVAPALTSTATVDMVVTSLNETIYADDFALR